MTPGTRAYFRSKHKANPEELDEIEASVARIQAKHRALARAEQVAERQTGALRQALRLAGRPKLPTDALAALAFLDITYRDGFPTSGMAISTPHG